jgi:hypothetical protein
MNKKIITIISVIALLAAGNIFLGIKCFLNEKQVVQAQEQLKDQQMNKKMVTFLNLFIEKVLKADKEVSFDDRLKLETAVRDLGDEDVLLQWEKFTESTSEAQVQIEVKSLLSLIVEKINK